MSTSAAGKKILIANRGEVAVRIAQTALRMGHVPVAIYSDADSASPHLELCTKAYHVGPPQASDSYLNTDRIFEICAEEGIDAIHPGYGFLAENASFARACKKRGIVFIGPTPETIQQMGDKILARQAADQAGVPMVPGTDQVKDEQEALQFAKEIGFPVLLKAKAGGGGKGMRRVEQPQDIEEAFRLAKSEAIKAFGDGTLYIEKCLVRPRHIEVQVFCDHHQNIYTLGDRECSIQRRHQKIIEEAPAFGLSDQLRENMSQVSSDLCKQVNYQGAGTIEYLVDKDENFYFLEMNTRLQVEHPVTEWITGLDLVALQIRAAFGQEILLDVHMQGHAIELRLYAEDADAQFMPQPGLIQDIKWPVGPNVRIDTGVRAGSEITLYYDPMVAKISVWSLDRKQSIAAALMYLEQTLIIGTKTNRRFLRQILSHPEYQQNKISTTFVEDNMPFAPSDPCTDQEIAAAIATWMLEQNQQRPTRVSGSSKWWTSRLPRFQWY